MDIKSKWKITDKEKEKYIDALTEELPILRVKVGVPQDELARLIGISRQTYGSIERRERRMSWNTYLSLVFFFDYNQATHKMLRTLSAFPSELIDRMNDSSGIIDIERIAGISLENIEKVLDEQAIHSIRTLIMLEYARCSDLSSEEILKSFNGKTLVKAATKSEVAVKTALKKIKGNECAKL